MPACSPSASPARTARPRPPSGWASALSRAGETAAVIGTLGVGLFQYQWPQRTRIQATGYTTPDQVLLARTLDECRAAGARSLAIEVSSIGLEQGRVAGMHFDVALFTNLTRDHLDFHGSMEAYEAAKAKAVRLARPESRRGQPGRSGRRLRMAARRPASRGHRLHAEERYRRGAVDSSPAWRSCAPAR
jgi:UDP-N-acetylmuramoylalanine-D-glutamate ligase